MGRILRFGKVTPLSDMPFALQQLILSLVGEEICQQEERAHRACQMGGEQPSQIIERALPKEKDQVRGR